jgi:hypothetical protein
LSARTVFQSSLPASCPKCPGRLNSRSRSSSFSASAPVVLLLAYRAPVRCLVFILGFRFHRAGLPPRSTSPPPVFCSDLAAFRRCEHSARQFFLPSDFLLAVFGPAPIFRFWGFSFSGSSRLTPVLVLRAWLLLIFLCVVRSPSRFRPLAQDCIPFGSELEWILAALVQVAFVS